MNPAQLETLLQQSVAHYQAMADLMRQLDGALALDDPELLADLQAQLELMQEQAGAADALIAPMLPASPVGALARLMAERMTLLEELQAQNRLISEKIRGILPVIADELAQLRVGQTAVSGYAGGSQPRGGNICGAF